MHISHKIMLKCVANVFSNDAVDENHHRQEKSDGKMLSSIVNLFEMAHVYDDKLESGKTMQKCE